MSNEVWLMAQTCNILVSAKRLDRVSYVQKALDRIRLMDGVYKVTGPERGKDSVWVWNITLKIMFVASPKIRRKLMKSLIGHFKGVPLTYRDEDREISYDRLVQNVYPPL